MEPGALMAVNHVLHRWLAHVMSRLPKTDPPTLVSLEDLQVAVMECVVHDSDLSMAIQKYWAKLEYDNLTRWTKATNVLDTLTSLYVTNQTRAHVLMAMECVTAYLVVRDMVAWPDESE